MLRRTARAAGLAIAKRVVRHRSKSRCVDVHADGQCVSDVHDVMHTPRVEPCTIAGLWV
jgi:hypothetical protein